MKPPDYYTSRTCSCAETKGEKPQLSGYHRIVVHENLPNPSKFGTFGSISLAVSKNIRIFTA